MDVATDVIQSIPQAEPENLLSYDDSVAYEQQVPTTTEEDPRSNLASRIGNTKIYLLSEATAAAHSAKVCLPSSVWLSLCETDQARSYSPASWLPDSTLLFWKTCCAMVLLVLHCGDLYSANMVMIPKKLSLNARSVLKSLPKTTR